MDAVVVHEGMRDVAAATSLSAFSRIAPESASHALDCWQPGLWVSPNTSFVGEAAS